MSLHLDADEVRMALEDLRYLGEHRERAWLDGRAAEGEADLLENLDAVLANGDLLSVRHRAAVVDDRSLLPRAVVEDVRDSVAVGIALVRIAKRTRPRCSLALGAFERIARRDARGATRSLCL